MTIILDGLEASALDRLEPITLEELDSRASLQTRLDRKYLLPRPLFEDLVGDFAERLRVLRIDGQREFGYRSVYFDTPELLWFHQHLQGRRCRFKVRTRTYLQSGLCRLEVKGKGRRSETVKKHRRYEADLASRLTLEAREFLGHRLGDHRLANRLRPMLDTRYRRTTLLDEVTGSRVTCDSGLTFHRGQSSAAAVGGSVLVETKSARGSGPVDRWLWRHHARPQSMSKYCLGVAMLYPGLRANPWHRILRHHFDWQPPAAPGCGGFEDEAC